MRGSDVGPESNTLECSPPPVGALQKDALYKGPSDHINIPINGCYIVVARPATRGIPKLMVCRILNVVFRAPVVSSCLAFLHRALSVAGSLIHDSTWLRSLQRLLLASPTHQQCHSTFVCQGDRSLKRSALDICISEPPETHLVGAEHRASTVQGRLRTPKGGLSLAEASREPCLRAE